MSHEGQRNMTITHLEHKICLVYRGDSFITELVNLNVQYWQLAANVLL